MPNGQDSPRFRHNTKKFPDEPKWAGPPTLFKLKLKIKLLYCTLHEYKYTYQMKIP